jgi:hypothetical protein
MQAIDSLESIRHNREMLLRDKHTRINMFALIGVLPLNYQLSALKRESLSLVAIKCNDFVEKK